MPHQKGTGSGGEQNLIQYHMSDAGQICRGSCEGTFTLMQLLFVVYGWERKVSGSEDKTAIPLYRV
jgi:hypothetical protein